MNSYHLSILTPAGEVFADEVDAIVAQGLEGSFGVLAQHAHMIAAVKLGVFKMDQGGSSKYFVLGEGILEVTENGVGILADTAETAESLEAAKKRVTEIEESFKEKAPPSPSKVTA